MILTAPLGRSNITIMAEPYVRDLVTFPPRENAKEGTVFFLI